ncbi:MAG: hypothetical protein H6883_07250 [Rhodobiaceae bacterium]|nr:hypothetical protein [Rhodobiaceae bacterium]MCC0055916.1 hypothetical protein [Rhodobiaceae bacterium]
MSIFEDFSFEWAGRKHVIPADRILKAIAVVEQHLTLHEISVMMGQRKTVRQAQLAAAYGALLRFVGEDVTDEDVYGNFFAGRNSSAAMVSGLLGLQKLMVPPPSYMEAKENTSKKSEPTETADSSKAPSKRLADLENSAAGD